MSIYFVRAEDSIKIGYSLKPAKRVKALQTSSVVELELLTLMPGDQAAERELHEVFADIHVRGEWFYDIGELSDFVRALVPVFEGYTAKMMSIVYNQKPKQKEVNVATKKKETGNMEQMIAKFVSENEGISSYGKLAEAMGKTKTSVYKPAKKMIDDGVMIKNGNGFEVVE